jgi:mono/diheme cytochrome c family protein
VASVDWQAPALNTVLLRFDEEELFDILVYGRPFSPMPAWGIEGGGALNDQQINNLIAYIEEIQISPEQAQSQAVDALETAMASGDFESEGEALFNLGLYDGFAGGAYSCGRCHTQGWSYGEPGDAGNGALGPNLTAVREQFPGGSAGFGQQVEFIGLGSERGVLYGEHGQGSGRMPGFGEMLTPEMIEAIVEYERNLGDE